MKSIFIISMLTFFVGCGTTPTKKEKGSLESEIDGITNDSFKSPKPKGYQAVDDFLASDLSDEPNVLKEESIAKVDLDELEEPLSVPKDLDQALLACYRKDYALADKIFDKILKEYKKNPIYWNQVGNCFMMKRNSRKALLYFNKARDLRSKYVPPINNIGVIFQKGGFYQKALKSYQEAKKVSSFSLTPVFNLAQIYAKFGFISEGKKLYQSLVRLNPNDQDALHGLAFMELAIGNFSNSVNIFSNMTRKYRKKAGVSANYAYALHMAGKSDDARDILDDIDTTSDANLNQYVSNLKRVVK